MNHPPLSFKSNRYYNLLILRANIIMPSIMPSISLLYKLSNFELLDFLKLNLFYVNFVFDKI